MPTIPPTGPATRPSRFVFFAPAPSERGGVQQRAGQLAQALAARGHQVQVFGRAARARAFGSVRRAGVRIVEVPGFGASRAGAILFLAVALTRGVAAAIRSDGVLALQLSSPATAAALCAWIAGRPFVVLSSTSGALSETSLLRSGVAGRLRRGLIGRARAVVAQTDEAAAELRAVLPVARVVVLPNPVRAALAPAPLSGAPRVAYAGRFSEEKGLPLLLEAWDVVAGTMPGARLTLVGDGGSFRSVEPQLRATVAASPRLGGSVAFTGWLDDAAGELQRHDVFVLASRSEGMSNALLEACALGRVVVASDIAANVAVLGDDYPLLFPVGDRTRLATALLAALQDEAVRARALRQIAARMGRFAPDAVAASLEALFAAP